MIDVFDVFDVLDVFIGHRILPINFSCLECCDLSVVVYFDFFFCNF